jgi:hypothetical protein
LYIRLLRINWRRRIETMDEQQLQEIEVASRPNGAIPAGAKVIVRTLIKELRRLKVERDELRGYNEELATMFGVVLDQVDYTRQACGPTEMVGAVLDKRVIAITREILEKQWKRQMALRQAESNREVEE